MVVRPVNHLNCEAALLPGLPIVRILACYAAAAGNEIESGKFSSPESSAALAANTFGYFLGRPADLPPLPGCLQLGWPARDLGLEACVFPQVLPVQPVWMSGIRSGPSCMRVLITPGRLSSVETVERCDLGHPTDNVAMPNRAFRDISLGTIDAHHHPKRGRAAEPIGPRSTDGKRSSIEYAFPCRGTRTEDLSVRRCAFFNFVLSRALLRREEPA